MKINVLWIDDEFDKQEDFITFAEQKDINIEAYDNIEDGLKKLNNNLNKYDAVILDAKVKEKANSEVANLKGLKIATDRLVEINKDQFLPSFIFTGQPDYYNQNLFKDIYPDFYIKGEQNEKLLKDITDQVNNKEEFEIKYYHQKFFDAYNELKIENGHDNKIIEILKSIKKASFKANSENEINFARKIIEQIYYKANILGIIDDKCKKASGVMNLTDACLYLSGKPTYASKIICNKTHLPKSISYQIQSILSLTGASGHFINNAEENKLDVSHYFNEIQTQNLLYTITFQVMDIVIWFNNYFKANNEIFKNKSYWKVTGEIKIDKDRNYFCNNHSIKLEQGFNLGDKIEIVNSSLNTCFRTSKLYPYFATKFEKI